MALMVSGIRSYAAGLLGTLLSLNCGAQQMARAFDQARMGDSRALHALIDPLVPIDAKKPGGGDDGGIRTAREIIPGVWEKSFDWMDNDKEGHGVGQYSIELISDGTTALYCLVLDRSTGTWVEGEAVWDRDTVLFVQDTVRLGELAARYEELYGDPMDRSDLFCDTIRYGRTKGRAARLPQFRERMEIMVQLGRPAYFDDWLTSANTEMQLYAVEGLFRLRWMGAHLNEHQRRCIRLIRKKKGLVRVCHGDVVGLKPIKDVFKSIPR